MFYQNKQTKEILTRQEMLKQFREEYDGGDDTNILNYTEYYLEVFQTFEELGQVVQTKGLYSAVEHNPEAQREVIEAFTKYKAMDWGDLNDHDKELNDKAIKYKNDRVLAKYHIESLNRNIYIITEWDRSVTTLLFTDEY